MEEGGRGETERISAFSPRADHLLFLPDTCRSDTWCARRAAAHTPLPACLYLQQQRRHRIPGYLHVAVPILPSPLPCLLPTFTPLLPFHAHEHAHTCDASPFSVPFPPPLYVARFCTFLTAHLFALLLYQHLQPSVPRLVLPPTTPYIPFVLYTYQHSFPICRPTYLARVSLTCKHGMAWCSSDRQLGLGLRPLRASPRRSTSVLSSQSLSPPTLPLLPCV